MVLSNRSERPFLLQMFRSPTMFFIFWLKVMPAHWGCQTVPCSTWTFWCFSAPLEFRNSRLMFTMETPFHTMFRRFSSVTLATGVASRFSSVAMAMNLSTSSGARATADALLALADGQLGAVQTLVLLGDLVQVDIQAVGQLTDGNGTPPAPSRCSA